MPNVLGFAGFGAAIFALISVIIATALNYWIYRSYEYGGVTFETYFGLWKLCSEPVQPTQDDCKSLDDSSLRFVGASFSYESSDVKVVRAMVLLALFLDVGGIVCGTLKLFIMKDKKIIGFVTAGLLLGAGLLLIVGFGVYVDKIFNPYKERFSENKPTLHAGFAFCIIAWLASWTSAALFGIATFQEKEGTLQ